MPHETILRLQHKVILIRERQQLTLHAPRLQHIERREALRDADAVVLGVVDDELRRGPVAQVLGGVPAAPVAEGCGWEDGFGTREVGVVPGRAAEVVQGEVEFFGGEHVGAAENTVVADEGFEFAAEVVALDPCLGC